MNRLLTFISFCIKAPTSVINDDSNVHRVTNCSRTCLCVYIRRIVLHVGYVTFSDRLVYNILTGRCELVTFQREISVSVIWIDDDAVTIDSLKM